MTFAIPAGFGATGAAVGDVVEAKGTTGATATDPPTLVRLEVADGSDDDAGQGDDVGHHSGDDGPGGDGQSSDRD